MERIEKQCIFVSHSSKDRELVHILVEFLQVGMGIGRDRIFCTSYPNELPTGRPFNDIIRERMKVCDAVFLVITDNFLRSQYCLAEMGAAWVKCDATYPLLLTGLEKLAKTPLQGVQVRVLTNENDVSVVYDELRNSGIITGASTAEYMRRLPKFIRQIQMLVNGDYKLERDKEGYFYAEIVEVRNVPIEYRCYRIKGHVEEWTGDDRAASDWLFFRAGVYDNLSVGDQVKFRFSRSEVKHWADIGQARNIYPDDLEKI